MQFAVPQFTDVEDKLIGPLTLKQFGVVLFAGGLCFMFWSLPIPKFIAIIIDLPIALAGIGVAFASYNGRPMLSYIFPFISYIISPKYMVFKRESNTVTVMAPTKHEKVEEKKSIIEESADSRLRKLAYLLDKKTEEQQDMIDQTIASSIERPSATAESQQSFLPQTSRKQAIKPVQKLPDNSNLSSWDPKNFK